MFISIVIICFNENRALFLLLLRCSSVFKLLYHWVNVGLSCWQMSTHNVQGLSLYYYFWPWVKIHVTGPMG